MSGSITLVSKRVPTNNYEKKAPLRRRKNRPSLAYVKCTSGQLHKYRQGPRSAIGGDTSSYGSITHYSRKLRPRSALSRLPSAAITNARSRIILGREKFTKLPCGLYHISNLRSPNYGWCMRDLRSGDWTCPQRGKFLARPSGCAPRKHYSRVTSSWNSMYGILVSCCTS